MKKMIAMVLCVMHFGAWATPGALDKNGCHDSKTHGYHCHGQSIDKIPASLPGESQKMRSLRLKAACAGLQNEGVCKGHTY